MTEQLQSAAQESIRSPQAQENIESLRSSGELGSMLADLYVVAIDEEPELTEVKIWAAGSTDPRFEFLKHTGGSAKHKGKSEIGRHELVINTDDGIGHFEKLLNTRRTSAEICAKKAGIEEGSITAKQLAAFIFLHELGHILDFIKNAPDLAFKEERRQRDMETLPLPGWNPADLMKFLEDSEGNSWFEDSKDFMRRFGIASKEGLISLQETAYHALKTEDIPDQFAVSIMKKSDLV